MARKKEIDLDVRNKAWIAGIAKKLFLEYGYEKTLMNDIAREADISKSTLYIYFKNKEEIRDYISLEAMQYLYDELKRNVVIEGTDLKTRYMMICRVLVEFKKSYPLSFQLIVEEIRVDDEALQNNEVLRKIYETGEQINQLIYSDFLTEMPSTSLRTNSQDTCESAKKLIMIMEQWGSIYGIITLADNKEAYLLKNFGVTKEVFLQNSFEHLFLNFSRSVEQ